MPLLDFVYADSQTPAGGGSCYGGGGVSTVLAELARHATLDRLSCYVLLKRPSGCVRALAAVSPDDARRPARGDSMAEALRGKRAQRSPYCRDGARGRAAVTRPHLSSRRARGSSRRWRAGGSTSRPFHTDRALARRACGRLWCGCSRAGRAGLPEGSRARQPCRAQPAPVARRAQTSRPARRRVPQLRSLALFAQRSRKASPRFRRRAGPSSRSCNRHAIGGFRNARSALPAAVGGRARAVSLRARADRLMGVNTCGTVVGRGAVVVKGPFGRRHCCRLRRDEGLRTGPEARSSCGGVRRGFVIDVPPASREVAVSRRVCDPPRTAGVAGSSNVVASGVSALSSERHFTASCARAGPAEAPIPRRPGDRHRDALVHASTLDGRLALFGVRRSDPAPTLNHLPFRLPVACVPRASADTPLLDRVLR